ncbi:non-ribosomal peptide synthetase [Archangium sp.]|uniref:non-ribosomal peptide synthetase n=1 Tax=Archangium sp. TaxID=1872627 RepID=UPI002D57CF48|nr:non-ribosomal peptide synthetase [Archangium sp.]HYO55831.1 amino acid adenylation domain-containing protein [Archangium sp.]
MAKRVAALSPEKREELLRRLREKESQAAAPQIVARDRARPAPLSFAQQRMWLLDQLQPGSSLYNNAASFRVEGALDADAFSRSFNVLVERHESLRTLFVLQDEGPVQVIQPSLRLEIPVVDLRGLPGPEREAEVRRLSVEEAGRPFELSRGPLMRVTLLRLDEQEHLMLLTLHHIIWDGWSHGVLMRELAVVYQAFTTGAVPSLPPLALQPADFAQWQRQWLQGEVLENQLSYWKQQLGGTLPVLQMPTDRLWPANPTFDARKHVWALPLALSEGLNALSRREGSSLFMTLLAAFKVLLSRYTGQQDLVVGSPIAGRTRRETEPLIGFFLNTLVLRTDLSGAPTFRELLARVRQTALAAYDHQDVPFELLVQTLQPEREANRIPLFQVLFILQNASSNSFSFSGLTITPRVGATKTQLDLTLIMVETPRGLEGAWEYSTELYDEETLSRLTGHFQRLLEGIVENPELRISELPLLPTEERQRLLVGWNDKRGAYPREECLHQIFEAQVERTPDAVAAEFREERLTYRELNRRANVQARFLVEQGVGPDTVVALLDQRGNQLFTAMLAVFKAGGAYLPLDPLHPAKRLAQVLKQSGAPVVLVSKEKEEVLGQALEELKEKPRVFTFEELARQGEGSNLPTRSNGRSLAYVIYTSGSTGVPKGAMLEQQGMVNHLYAKVEELELKPSDVVAQTASQCFDISVWQHFCALAVGGRTLIVEDEVAHQPLKLLEAMERHGMTVVETVPSLLRAVEEEAAGLGEGRPGLLRLRWMVPTGEALPPEVCRRWFQLYPHVPLLNAYGPTECSDDVTHHPMREASTGAITPIGRPVRNTQLYVLDARMQLVPTGVPGELYVGGDGVGRGYLKEPGRTAEVFVPDPFTSQSGRRMYKTGDLVRYRVDGALEFLGRLDHQVKVRGFRIELGEIEAALGQHPAVREVVVVAREDEPGKKRLVAYLSWREEGATVDAVRTYLKDRLPEYMVPATYVVLDALPLSSNGKVDRKALPVPDAGQQAAEGFVAPRNVTEEMVAGIWAQLLGVERVGVHDNFFELGGHSLVATQVISRLRGTFEVELALPSFFEAPTVAELARLVESTRESKLSLQAPPLVPTPREGALPLSFAQQRLWFMDHFQPGDTSYNVPAAVRLQGQLDVGALERSLQDIIRRHESLRTTFPSVNGQPVQRISAELPLQLVVDELEKLSEQEREAEVQRRADDDARQPFDLEKGPMMRTRLLRLAPQTHVLLLTMHHIVSDFWSINLLFQELGALYDAHRLGKPSPLPQLPIQYADFARWQRQWLSGKVLDAQLSYWKTQLAGAPAILELPTDRPRPPVRSARGALTPVIELPPALSESLRKLSQKEGVSLFMLLEAAFRVLLHRYGGQEDFSLGTTVAGRTRTETEGLIGPFINALVLRVNMAQARTFRELLARVRQTALGAFAHQDIPFEKLVEEMAPTRDLSHSPFFQVAFELRKSVASLAMEIGGLQVSPVVAEPGTAKFDLALVMFDRPEGLLGYCEYSTDLYDATTIQRMMGHLRVLLEAIAAQPEARLSALSLLSEAERRQMLLDWNATALPAPEACLHELFQEQAARTPEAVALSFEGSTYTYGELDRWSNQLAHYLLARGVGPDVLVGLCMDRGLDLVVGMLGILKAGGAYLPLDPTYPIERLTYMLNDAGVPVLVTQERLADELPSHGEFRVSVDVEANEIAQEPETPPQSGVTPGNLSYAIYTSGSTGKPKGVLVEHRGVSNTIRGAIHDYDVKPGQKVLQFASASFDVSVLEIFTTLLGGGTLVLASKDDLLPGPDLVQLLRSNRITTMMMTPSVLATLPPEELPALRTVVVGGEACSAELMDRWAAGRRFVNAYGPTETSINATSALCVEGSGRPPIGRAYPNVQVYVLDRHLLPVPIGVTGELYVGGKGVGRGYLSSPELAAERFVPNPFSQTEGSRLYRTGDLVRYRPDGNLEFVGRVDTQVKLRGFRIELGEIETRLIKHPDLRAAAVVVREDVPGVKRLVAYVVPSEGRSPAMGALKEFLEESLPEYMVPSAFVEMEALPLTPNGKVDEKALPAPGRSVEQAASFVAPSNRVEEKLAGIWMELLGEDKVGIHDNFFDLGGNSLMAMQVASRIREVLQVEVPVRQLFETPTVAGLAQSIGPVSHAVTLPPAPPLVPVPRGAPLPLSFAQQRLWVQVQLEPSNAAFNFPLAMRLKGRLDIEALKRSFEALTQRHETMRTTFSVVKGQPVQIIAPEMPLPMPLVDLQHLPEQEREAEVMRRVKEDPKIVFDLVRGPMVRTTLLRLAPEEHVLVLTTHHIATDAWSGAIFFRELTVFYAAFSSGTEPELPPLPIQYADFAQWQRKWLQGEVLEAQRTYWKNHLMGLPVLELPTDRPRPSVQTFRGDHQRMLLLSRETTEQLEEVGRQEGATLFMTLLAAFKVLMYRYSGQTDIVVGSPIAGRSRSEVEGLIGFFVNNLALRTRFTGDMPFNELLRRVREATLGAYAHQDMPFEQLVDEVQPERDLSRSPLFQATLSLQNAPSLEAAFAGLELSMIEVDSPTSKWDLSFFTGTTPDGLAVLLEYSTDLFDTSTVLRMATHFQSLLEGIAVDPERRLAELPLMKKEERQRLLVEWNDTRTEPAREARAHRLLEQVVEQRPDAVAVSFESSQLTYRELNLRANQMAYQLRALGIGPEMRVAICMERSLEMVVGLLGIMKSGAAYVPLDPSYPKDRLSFILEDAEVEVLLTQPHLEEVLPDHGARVLHLSPDWASLADEFEANPPEGAEADNLAYIIYTSGSTGRPKGVQLAHRGLCNTALAASRALALTPESRVLQFAAFGFDASVWEIFSTLLTGAHLVLAPREAIMPGPPLHALLEEKGVTAVTLTPSALAPLEPERLKGLRTVVSAGEACTPELARRWKEGRLFINAYGPTETTVCATLNREVDAQRPTIGRPLPNVQVYVLDERLQPVPVGVAGHLYVSGVGVARGYLGRPDLTAERFLPHPFGAEPGARLYRTGDLARYLSNGELEFLGRADQQVKLRGFRIELGEVEAVLAQHPMVREAVVSLRKEAGDERLVAYLVMKDGQEPDPAALRGFLKEKLPEYMVPAAFVGMEALPLTPNDKMDRGALPAPAQEAVARKDYVAPRTSVEEILAGLWADIFECEQVGIHDNFFDLGGHSMLGIQLFTRIQEIFDVEIPLLELFERPTVAMLAERVEAAQPGERREQVAPIVPTPPAEYIPLSFSQQNYWLPEQQGPENPYHVVPLAFRVDGPLDAPALTRSLEEILRRHEALRTTFPVVDGTPVQRIHPEMAVSLPVVELGHLPEAQWEAEARRMAREVVWRPFDLANGPLMRFGLYRFSKNAHLLVLAMHHVLIDLESAGVFLAELMALYGAFRDGKPSPLPEPSVQYRDYTRWQRERLQGERLERLRAYWKQRMDPLPTLKLPFDRPYPERETFRSAQHAFTLSPALTKQLYALARREGVTPFILMLSALKALLHRYSGQEQIAVFSATADRARPELEKMIGLFARLRLLRVDLSGDPSFREMLKRVRAVSLGSPEHEELPYVELVKLLPSTSGEGQRPLSRVAFSFSSLSAPALDGIGLELKQVPLIDYDMMLVDLSVTLFDSPEGLQGTLAYKTDVFDASTIQAMYEHLRVLLECIAADPDQRLSTFPPQGGETQKAQVAG